MATNSKACNIGNTEGFDKFMGRRWVYPNNMPIRGYQKQAVEKALFTNAMIVLPTGFGKTFIAAVVMHNFYHWYPTGKIIFVAPTKPLVTQQFTECKKISGIPSSDCSVMTGTTFKTKRHIIWEEKRVFFATPQVIENDLEDYSIPAKQVRCLVIDEAHRAQGSFAYVKIVEYLHQRNKDGFRILALSATPGSDIQRVQQVMLNLHIGDVMFKTENDIDLMRFKNEKVSKAWTVDLVGRHKEFVDLFIKLTSQTYKELHRAGLTWGGDSIDRVARFTLILAINRMKGNPEFARTRGRLNFLCNLAVTLSNCFEMLTIYGLRVFYSSVMKDLSKSKSNIRTTFSSKIEFDVMIEKIRNMFGNYLEIDSSKKPDASVDLLLSHPKLRVLKDLLFKHFQENEHKGETRVMVFTKYRDSVFDIVQSLLPFDEIIKPGAFVGQGKKTETGGGMTQAEQIQMVKDFKSGKYNVLVATCVAEEGLDIGEVDLIICYDTTSSPISNTQRRGRTGRKRSGNVQTLCTKGYEEKRLRKAGDTRRQVESQLFKRENYMTCRYQNAPRLVPAEIVPICLEQKIHPVDDDVEPERPRKKRRTTTKTVGVAKKKNKKISDDESDDKKNGDNGESGKSDADNMKSDHDDNDVEEIRYDDDERDYNDHNETIFDDDAERKYDDYNGTKVDDDEKKAVVVNVDDDDDEFDDADWLENSTDWMKQIQANPPTT